jgi:hypothetical protein
MTETRPGEQPLCPLEALLPQYEERTLLEFGCWCAARVLARQEREGLAPDLCLRQAVEQKQLWLAGESTDERMAAAWERTQEVVTALKRAAKFTGAGAASWTCAYSVSWGTAGPYVRRHFTVLASAYHAARADAMNAGWLASLRADPRANWLSVASLEREERRWLWVPAWDAAYAAVQAEQQAWLKEKR